ncbi:MAG: SDR family oxidoreductase [Planctomycetes bacterium]|nr:SDR family oxidoreductase [Planctomycetota bacterium]
MTMERKTAVVTGASSGIGAELARIHAAHGGSLVMIARRREKLEALKAELEKTYGIAAYVLVQDLTEAGAAQQVHDHVRSLGLAVDVLVNNAGFGYWGPFHEQDWSVNEALIKVNILVLAALTRIFVPEMVARGHGRVLNVASMAGFVPGPLHAVYYASKAFVVSFSEALANELAGTGVTVTALCPGPTETEFARTPQMRDVHLTRRMDSARRVAVIGYEAMRRGKPLVVPGLLNKITTHGLLRLSPRRLTTRVARRLNEKR